MKNESIFAIFSTRIPCSKICEKYTDVWYDEKKLHGFFQIFSVISFAKKCEKPNSHNLRLLIQYLRLIAFIQ